MFASVETKSKLTSSALWQAGGQTRYGIPLGVRRLLLVDPAQSHQGSPRQVPSLSTVPSAASESLRSWPGHSAAATPPPSSAPDTPDVGSASASALAMTVPTARRGLPPSHRLRPRRSQPPRGGGSTTASLRSCTSVCSAGPGAAAPDTATPRGTSRLQGRAAGRPVHATRRPAARSPGSSSSHGLCSLRRDHISFREADVFCYSCCILYLVLR